MYRYLILFVVVGFVLYLCPVSASNLIIRDINEQYGLTKNRVNCMLQDSTGFLWFGMANGLYKFDQNTFLKYDVEDNDFPGFNNSEIVEMIEYKPGWLLISSYDNGLLVFNSIKEKYDSVICNSPIDFSKLAVICMYQAQDGTVWLGTEQSLIQLECIGNRRNRFEVLNHFNQNNADLISYCFVDIKESQEGKLWFLTLSDIGYIQSSSSDVFSFPAPRSNSSFVFEKNNQILKACYETGLSEFNIEQKMFREIQIQGVPGNTQARVVYKDSRSNIWIGISNAGLIKLDSVSQNAEPNLISNKIKKYAALNSNVIYEVYETNDGAIWICTEEGISMIKDMPEKFHSKSFTSKINPELTLGVRSLLHSDPGYIWTGTIGEGLKKFDVKSNKIFDVSFKNNDGIENIGKNVQAILEDSMGNLWLGTEGEGLIQYFPEKKEFNTRGNKANFRTYLLSETEHSLCNNYIMSLLEDQHHNLWIGTWQGLSLIDSSELMKSPESKIKIRNFFHDPKDKKSLSNNTIMSLLEDKNGNIWVGTRAGLNKMIRTSRGYQFKHDFRNRKGEFLLEKKILDLHQSKNNDIWFSIQNGGICQLNSKTGVYQEYNSNNGFHNYVVNSISEDSLGIFWLGTNNGLCRFDPSRLSFKFYDKENGLFFNDFYFKSNCRINDKLYFGGNHGIIYFNPYQIRPSTFKPHLVFTDLKLFNESVKINSKNAPIDKHISQAKQIELNHNQNYVTLFFAALNYSQYEQSRYSCSL